MQRGAPQIKKHLQAADTNFFICDITNAHGVYCFSSNVEGLQDLLDVCDMFSCNMMLFLIVINLSVGFSKINLPDKCLYSRLCNKTLSFF